jgi:hypothetical protein
VFDDDFEYEYEYDGRSEVRSKSLKIEEPTDYWFFGGDWLHLIFGQEVGEYGSMGRGESTGLPVLWW